MAEQTDARPSKSATPAKKAAPKPQAAAEPPAATVQDKPQQPSVRRAGGWIDRGDGRGWELEE
jgi:hypothetical protein